jgi:hypothetical protein
MNATHTQFDSNDREELARLVPGSVERELPSDRHRQLQEFVMSEIHRNLHVTAQAPRRSPRRRLVYLTSALTAVVAAAVAVAVGTGGTGGAGGGTAPPETAAPSGHEILLAAATTAQRQPDTTGTYWYLKVVSRDSTNESATQWETWAQPDGQHWYKSGKTGDKAVKMPDPARYTLGKTVNFKQLQDLPTEPDALKAWIVEATNNSDVRTSAGEMDPQMKEKHVFYGLISLISQLPVTPRVRSAAFQVIAAYPNVTSLGPVDGGLGLLISLSEGPQARLVVDPATSQIRRTNFLVLPQGGLYIAGEGGSITLDAMWTDSRPE